MRFTSRICLTAGLALVLCSQVQAQAPALKDMRAPDGAQVADMCARIDTDGLRAGATHEEIGEAALRTLREDTQIPAPLLEANAEFTPWSGRLAAIAYSGDGFEGMETIGWFAKLSETLDKYGWQLVTEEGEGYPALMQTWQRAFPHEAGQREMTVEIEEYGAFGLRCGPSELIALKADETAGILAPGSPRPLPPRPEELANPEEILAQLDCTNPQLIAQFAGAESLDQIGPILETVVGDTLDLDAGSRYDNRLHTWLQWRLRTSGKVSDEEMWAVEDSLGHGDGSALTGEGTAMLAAMGRITDAFSKRDGAAICTGMRDMLQSAISRSQREAELNATYNAALEALARQHGLDLD